jgi:hypothetical protein
VFIGHAAAGFAAKRFAPRASLAWLLAAPWLLDLLWPVFLLTGIEHVRIDPGNTVFTPLDFVSYPWSHSLLMALVWSALFGAAYRHATRDTQGTWIVGGLVASHWVFDLVVHRADLPLAPGLAIKAGLGLWNSVPGTLAVEGGLFALGLAIYLHATRARGVWGVVSLSALVVFLLGIYAGNLTGPPPPSTSAIAWVTLGFGALIVPWAMGIERTRARRGPAGGRDGS